MKTKVHQDIYIGIFLILLSSFFLVLSREIKAGAEILPRLLLIIIIIMSIFILLNGIKKSREIRSSDKVYKPMFDMKDMTPALKTYFFILVYLLLFYLTGYFISTVVFLLYFMNFLGMKNKKIIFTTSGIFLIVLYFFFVKQLNVPILGLGMLGKLL